MTSAGMTGGTASGYAGQPSRHISGSDLTTDTRDTDRGYGSFASGNATNLGGIEDTHGALRDPRDKDADGWVADDKMREWGRDIKDAVTGAGHKVNEEGRELRDEGRYQMDEAERRRRRARVYDRSI
jgi:hypothetical protein